MVGPCVLDEIIIQGRGAAVERRHLMMHTDGLRPVERHGRRHWAS
jgi:hypothetical protein